MWPVCYSVQCSNRTISPLHSIDLWIFHTISSGLILVLSLCVPSIKVSARTENQTHDPTVFLKVWKFRSFNLLGHEGYWRLWHLVRRTVLLRQTPNRWTKRTGWFQNIQLNINHCLHRILVISISWNFHLCTRRISNQSNTTFWTSSIPSNSD